MTGSATPTRTGTSTRTATATRSPTRTAPPATATATQSSGGGASAATADCFQLGCDAGATGYVDRSLSGRPLALAWEWEQERHDETWLVQPLRLPDRSWRLAVWYGPPGAYDNVWKMDGHEPSTYLQLRDVATGAVLSDSGVLGRSPTWQDTWPIWYHPSDSPGILLGKIIEDGAGGVTFARGKATLSGAAIGGGGAEIWAHLATSELLGVTCAVQHWTWHGGPPASVWCEDTALSGRRRWVYWQGKAWIAHHPTDDVFPGRLAIDETHASLVTSLHFSLDVGEDGSERPDGLYVYPIDLVRPTSARTPRCLVRGDFGQPAVRDGIAYVVRDRSHLLALNTGTCERLEVAVPGIGMTPWTEGPIVAPDLVYLLAPSLSPAAEPWLTGDVWALDRHTLAPAWHLEHGGVVLPEVRAYGDRADFTHLLADRDSLYVAGRDALLVVDRLTGELRQSLTAATAPEGFRKLVPLPDGVAALQGFRLLQYPPCQERMCDSSPPKHQVDYARCCRGWHAHCERPDDSACPWHNPEIYRRASGWRAYGWRMQ